MTAQPSTSDPQLGLLLQPEHLAHALRLVVGTSSRRADRPDVAAAAAALGVSSRQVQRWLQGTTTPSAGSRALLAELLRPSSDLREQEASEVDYATRAAKAMALPRGRGIKSQWREQGWHHRHTVYVLHHPGLAVSRVAIVGSGAKALEAALTLKPRPIGGHWGIQQTLEQRNYFEAVLQRADVLRQNEALRVVMPRALMRRSGSLCWLSPAAT